VLRDDHLLARSWMPPLLMVPGCSNLNESVTAKDFDQLI
jgi:hypothetical protein